MHGVRKPNVKVQVELVPELDKFGNKTEVPSLGCYLVRDML